MLVLADLVSLDTPLVAAAVAKDPITFDAPTESVPTREPPTGDADTDRMNYTAPMSRPPKSAVPPVPGGVDATLFVANSGGKTELRPAAPTPVEATILSDGPVGALPKAAGARAPTPLPIVASKPGADPLLGRFEALDRRVRPMRAAILFGLAVAVGAAEAFDSAIGSYPIFRTLALAAFWIGALTILAARVAGAHDDDEGWTMGGAIAELRGGFANALADLQAFSDACATHRRRLIGKTVLVLGLVGLAGESIVDATRLVLGEYLHIGASARPDVAGHATLLPIGVASIGALLLFFVSREAHTGELHAPKEVLLRALPLHARPLLRAQLVEQSRLFPPAYQPVLVAIAGFTPGTGVVAPTLAARERMLTGRLENAVLRAVVRAGAARDVAGPGDRSPKHRAGLVVGGSVAIDVTCLASEADVERAAVRARRRVDEGSGTLVVGVLLGDRELAESFTRKTATLRERAPLLTLAIDDAVTGVNG